MANRLPKIFHRCAPIALATVSALICLPAYASVHLSTRSWRITIYSCDPSDATTSPTPETALADLIQAPRSESRSFVAYQLEAPSDPPAPIPSYLHAGMSADFDANGKVNHLDFSTWETDFGTSGGGDADGDGKSTGLDFLVWQSQRGYASTVDLDVSSNPEPAALAVWGALATLCGLIYGRRRRAY